MNFVLFAAICYVFILHPPTALSEFPPQIYHPAFAEPCPKDSVSIGGACKCDHKLCTKPPCLTVLVQVTNVSDTPGSCCPTYACEGCSEDDKINDRCPCLPGATLRSGRECECSDPHRVIRNGTCVCDPNRCELPNLCNQRAVEVREIVGCCEKVRCITCPDDSFPTDYKDPQVEDKCLCFPCSPIKCGANQRPTILRWGKGVPEMCCDIYKCVDDTDSAKGCIVNGTVYKEGETWISSLDDKCRCENGLSFCLNIEKNNSRRSCLYGEKVYKHLDTWLEDICTNCTCNDGEAKCIAHLCDVHVTEVKKPALECASLANCKKNCEYGFRLNRQGCEICKCKPSDKTVIIKDKYAQLDTLLKEYNLTETDVIDIIREHRLAETDTSTSTSKTSDSTTSSTTTSTARPLTTICFTDNKGTHGECAYSCFLEYAIPGFIVGTIFGGVALFSFLKCSEKNHQKYKMAYTYKPVGKEAAADKTALNFSPIIKSKNFELQSYNEKKNVI